MTANLESSVILKPPPPWWRRWLKRLGKAVLLLAIALACRQAWHHHQASKRLEETLAEIDRAEPGWRLEDIEAAREQIPEEENSARVLVVARKLLPQKWPAPAVSDVYVHVPPEEQLAPEDFARLKQDLDNYRPALNEARKLADMPRGRHHIAYQRNVLSTLLKDQAEVRPIVRLLVQDAMRHDQNRDMTNAMIACRAALNAGRSLGDEPLGISQLIRGGCVVSACQAVERALAQGEPPLEELTAFRKLLDSEDAFPDLLITARGERGADQALFDAMESGDVSIAELADGRPGWQERLLGFLYRDNIRAEHPTMIALMSRWVAIAQLPSHEQAEAEQQFNQDIRDLPKTAILTRLLLPALTKLGEASRRKHACIRCMILTLAAERYRRKYNKWPDSLDKLCPHFLADVPLDPFDGSPLRYHRLDDGVVIYSVSTDGVDNGGNLDREHPHLPGADVGVRLWDVAKRRQPPKPKPPPPPLPAWPPSPAPNPG